MLASWPESVSEVISHVDSLYLWYDVMKMTLNPCGLPPITPNPQSNFDKNIETNPSGGPFYKIPDQQSSNL